MANTEVPADTLPVRTETLFVATIPVPASPSGGQSGIPPLRFPETSRSFAPSSVSTPALSPAVSTPGIISSSFHEKPLSAIALLNLATISELNCLVDESIGNIPDASPTPRTFSPVSFQWI